jgi:hypothetical protein
MVPQCFSALCSHLVAQRLATGCMRKPSGVIIVQNFLVSRIAGREYVSLA